MADEHERTRDVRAVKSGAQVRRHCYAVLLGRSRITPTTARATVHAYPRVGSERRRTPSPTGARRAEPWFENDGGSAAAGTAQMKPVSADINELPGRHIRAAVERLSNGLIAPSNSTKGVHTQQRIHKPGPCATVQTPVNAHDRYNDERKEE